MGPIQQSLNSIATTAMDAIRTKEALASQNEREQREAYAKNQQALEEQASKELQEYSKGDREEFSKEVLPKIFGNEQRWSNTKVVRDRYAREWQKYAKYNSRELAKMSNEEKVLKQKEIEQQVADKLFLKQNKYSSQETYQLSRIFDTMQDMVKGNRYAQQAAIQLSDKIDTALNHMQSRKRWR